MSIDANKPGAWHQGISRYQWLVLMIASLGWVFDVFEGQIFVASMNEAIPSLAPRGTEEGRLDFYNNVALGAFLLGGALGGILFGALSDRIGRKKTLSLTILFYSLFTCASAFSEQWWHLAAWRFLVAMGVGGEWAVASSMVAEVFPSRARAHVGSIFHASSVFGTYLAVLAGWLIIGNPAIQEYAKGVGIESLPWRIGFALGALPALLIIWIRRSLHEPESWTKARAEADRTGSRRLGSIPDLFSAQWRRQTFVGLALATIGLVTFWGAHVYGKNLLTEAVDAQAASTEAIADSDATNGDNAEASAADKTSRKRWEMLGMFLVTTGGGLGLVCFGPISERFGRRGAFLFYHVGGLIIAVVAFQFLHGLYAVLVVLPIFGFLTLGMHAGYAVYFPELYPTRLRATGAGFCFNGGRILAAFVLVLRGWMRDEQGGNLSERDVGTILSMLFLAGVLTLWFAPETKGRELPE